MRSIPEIRDACKGLLSRAPRDVLVLALLVGAALASFALGYVAGQEEGRAGVLVKVVPPASVAGGTITVEGRFVASKSGGKYYLPTCAGAMRISETNRVWFASAEDAEAEGYTPAANCPGL